MVCGTNEVNDKGINQIEEKIMNTDNRSGNSIDKFKNLISCNRKFLKMIHFNAQGMLEGMHFEHICNVIDKLDLDVIAISVTWLKRAINNMMIAIDGYQIVRSDRNFDKNDIKKGGGGVCMYVRNGLKIAHAEKSNGPNYKLLDFLFLEIQSRTSKFLVCSIYRRGDCTDEETGSVLNRINEISIDFEHVFVCGDFNANVFDKNKFRRLHMLTNNLTLMNDDCPTYIAGNFHPSQLDLFFTKNVNDWALSGCRYIKPQRNICDLYHIYNQKNSERISDEKF